MIDLTAINGAEVVTILLLPRTWLDTELTKYTRSTSEMRNMLAICDKFADEYNVVFNAKKSKCLYITSHVKQSRLLSAPPQFTIGDNVIEFVDKWPHLGHYYLCCA